MHKQNKQIVHSAHHNYLLLYNFFFHRVLRKVAKDSGTTLSLSLFALVNWDGTNVNGPSIFRIRLRKVTVSYVFCRSLDTLLFFLF